jgi:hypothetical protein
VNIAPAVGIFIIYLSSYYIIMKREIDFTKIFFLDFNFPFFNSFASIFS